VFAQNFDIMDEGGRRIRAQVGIGRIGQRPAPPAPALVEQNRTIRSRIEQAPLSRRAAGTGSTVQKECRFSVRVSAALPRDEVPVPDVQEAAIVGFHRRALSMHLSAGSPMGIDNALLVALRRD
jgi:hypothetical protein